jgi:hypothetical protein
VRELAIVCLKAVFQARLERQEKHRRYISTDSIKMVGNRIRHLLNLNLYTNIIGHLPESHAHINSSRLFPTTFIPGVPGSDLGITEISFSPNKTSRRMSNWYSLKTDN